MGRESRQARRAKERRQQELQQRKQRTSRSSPFASRWSVIAGIAVVLAAAGVFVSMALTGKAGGTSSADPATATAQAQLTPVAGLAVGPVQCTYNEMVSAGFYHVHSHLTLLDAGRELTIPSNIGFKYSDDCLYWTHTHSPSGGIIHIESPYTIKPTLGDFFRVWGVPISSHRVWKLATKAGQKMRVWLNQRPYKGNPANIPLKSHQDIVIEVGPPFKKMPPYNFGDL